jgi:hypothetical protein
VDRERRNGRKRKRKRKERVTETGSLTFSVEPGGSLWEATTEHR